MKYIILEKSKKNNFFSYVNLASDKWNELVREAMKTFNVYFDLENNSTMKQQRVIIIPQNEWEFTKCKFKCEIFSAGGDWQWPVRYFRCQLVDGYAFRVQKYKSGGMFVYIPGKTEGNYHLVPGKSNSKWCAPDSNDHKKGIDPEPDERKCWESLKLYLKSLVTKEIEKVEEENAKTKENDENTVGVKL